MAAMPPSDAIRKFGIISPVFSSLRCKAERTEAHRMAKDGFKVMDSDMHIVEPIDLWERYIDPVFKDRAPRGLRRHPRDLGVQVGESIFPLPNRSYTQTPPNLVVKFQPTDIVDVISWLVVPPCAVSQ